VLCPANGLALTRGAASRPVQTSTALLRRRRVQRLLGRACYLCFRLHPPVPRRIPPSCSMTAAINGFT
jgi:hypothetical protein